MTDPEQYDKPTPDDQKSVGEKNVDDLFPNKSFDWTPASDEPSESSEPSGSSPSTDRQTNQSDQQPLSESGIASAPPAGTGRQATKDLAEHEADVAKQPGHLDSRDSGLQGPDGDL